MCESGHRRMRRGTGDKEGGEVVEEEDEGKRGKES
jgi:hypothetical protein